MSEFEGSSIRKFFSGRSILITGATGFLGSSLIQRLLTTTTIKTVYVLIREKSDLTLTDRVNRFLKCATFRTIPPNAIKKIVPVKGDVSHRNLGLSHSARQQLLDDVTIVFNCAASVDWEGPIGEEIKQNVFSTQNIIEFCEQLTHQAVLVHTSTVAAWSNNGVLEECIPINESWSNYEHLLSEARINKQFATKLTNNVVGDFPKHVNTYAFSKSMAELAIKKFVANNPNSNLQIVIVRLPLLGGALREPSPGHVPTFQAATLLNCFAALGLIQNANIWPLDATYLNIPVDMCSNALIAISYVVGRGLVSDDVINVFPKPGEVPMIRDIAQFAADVGNEYPSLSQVAPPLAVSKFDFVNSLRGRLNEIKLKWMASRRRMKLNAVTEAIDLTRRVSRLVTKSKVVDNLDKVLSSLSPEEREVFYYEFRDIDWKTNLRETFLQFRRQRLEEGDDNLTIARRRLTTVKLMWHGVDCVVVLIGLLIMFWAKDRIL